MWKTLTFKACWNWASPSSNQKYDFSNSSLQWLLTAKKQHQKCWGDEKDKHQLTASACRVFWGLLWRCRYSSFSKQANLQTSVKTGLKPRQLSRSSAFLGAVPLCLITLSNLFLLLFLRRKADLKCLPSLKFYIIGNIESSSSFDQVCLSESWCSSQSTLFSEGKIGCNTSKEVWKSDRAKNLRGQDYSMKIYLCSVKSKPTFKSCTICSPK